MTGHKLGLNTYSVTRGSKFPTHILLSLFGWVYKSKTGSSFSAWNKRVYKELLISKNQVTSNYLRGSHFLKNKLRQLYELRFRAMGCIKWQWIWKCRRRWIELVILREIWNVWNFRMAYQNFCRRVNNIDRSTLAPMWKINTIQRENYLQLRRSVEVQRLCNGFESSGELVIFLGCI